MRKWLPSDALWTIVILLGILVALGVAVIMAAQVYDPARQPLYLSYGTHPKGVKAFAQLLRKNGYRVQSFRTSFKTLPPLAGSPPPALVVFPFQADSRAILLQRALEEENKQRLKEWVASGGNLIVFGWDPRLGELNPGGLLGKGRYPPIGGLKPPSYVGYPLLHSAWTTEVQAVEGEDQGVRLQPSSARWVPLIADKKGVVVALRLYGRGKVVEFSEPSIATNEYLRKRQNALLLLNLVSRMVPQGGVVYFDDCGQGDCEREASAKGFWRNVPAAGRIAFAHLMLLAIVVMYSVGRRFGLARPSPPRLPALGEHVEALAELYRSARATHAALEILLEHSIRTLRKRYGLPASATGRQLLQMLPPDLPAKEVVRRAYEALQKDALDEQEALQIARDLHHLML